MGIMFHYFAFWIDKIYSFFFTIITVFFPTFSWYNNFTITLIVFLGCFFFGKIFKLTLNLCEWHHDHDHHRILVGLQFCIHDTKFFNGFFHFMKAIQNGIF